MSEWLSYRLADFVPFSADVYRDLLIEHAVASWPVAAVATVALVVGIWRKDARLAGLVLAMTWIFTGMRFYLMRYADLLWGAQWLGYIAIVQGIIMAVDALRAPRELAPRPVALYLGAITMVGFPLMIPDSIALATIGYSLMRPRFWPALIAGVVLTFSALTWLALAVS